MNGACLSSRNNAYGKNTDELTRGSRAPGTSKLFNSLGSADAYPFSERYWAIPTTSLKAIDECAIEVIEVLLATINS